MRNSSFFKYSVLPLAALGVLGGCKSLINKPHFIPSGYTYHGQEYQSPPPSKADSLGYEYSVEQNEQILDAWRFVAEDMASTLENQIGLYNADIYIRVPLDVNPQMATFDHVLREVLIEHGHRIISDHYAGVILTYNIIDPDSIAEEEKGRYSYNDTLDQTIPPESKGDYSPMAIELIALDKTTTMAKVQGIYTVPMYGYENIKLPKIWEPVPGQKINGVYDEQEKRFNE